MGLHHLRWAAALAGLVGIALMLAALTVLAGASAVAAVFAGAIAYAVAAALYAAYATIVIRDLLEDYQFSIQSRFDPH